MTTVAIDPRLRARRVAVRRAAGRRRLRRLMVVLVLALGAVASWSVVRSPLLDVDRMEIHGLDRVSLSAVESAMDVSLGAAMMDVDPAALEARLEALPWIDEASVDRNWPGTLVVEVTERTAIAVALADLDVWVMVDAEGRVLTGPLAQVPDLPRLSGVRGAGEPGSFMAADAAAPLAVLAALPDDFSAVQAVWRDSRGDLQLSMADGTHVVLGDDSQLRAKAAAALTMIDHLRANDRSGQTVDVSVPTLPIVRAAEP